MLGRAVRGDGTGTQGSAGESATPGINIPVYFTRSRDKVSCI